MIANRTGLHGQGCFDRCTPASRQNMSDRGSARRRPAPPPLCSARMTQLATLELLLFLLAGAVMLALLARRLGVPSACVFVLGGMGLAITPGVPKLDLAPELTMALFLPPLLLASAYFTVWRDFRDNLRPILLLAVGAVAFTTAAVGWVLKLLVPDLPWAACFTLGAIVSPPDAVSAAAVLEKLRIPRRLLVILEGESLVNDASGLVLYRFGVVAALTGAFSTVQAVGTFVLVGAGGIAVGYACGRGAIWVLRRLDDTYLEIAASFLAAWGSYLVAERIGVSGVLSTVTCGLVMGLWQHETVSSRTRMESNATWSFIVFVLEAMVFILIGLSLNGVLTRISGWRLLIQFLPLAAIISATVIVTRFIWVFPATYLPRLLIPAIRRADPYPPWQQPAVIGWAGMRGVVSLAAALALPEGFPGRDLILLTTFGVILATVLIQGTTLGPLIVALGVETDKGDDGPPPEAKARLEVDRAMLQLMEDRATDPLDGAIAQDLVREYRDRAGWSERVHGGGGAVRAERTARLALRLEALGAGRQKLLELHGAEKIHDEVLRQIEQDLDLEEVRLRRMLPD